MGIYGNNIFAPAIKINQPIIPSGTLSIEGTGLYNVYSYSSIFVNIEDLLDKRITTGLDYYLDYTDLSANKINSMAFAYQKIQNINMPLVSTIGDSAFFQISISKSINFSFPNCTSIGSCAFGYAGGYVYNSDINISVYLNSNLSIIPSSCFYSNKYLTEINTLNCKNIYNYAFASCYNLTNISLPSCISISNYAFSACSSLISISIPSCKDIRNYALARCISLSSISLPACSYIGNNAFNGCYNLLSVYLNVSSMVSLNNINAFASTPISNYTTSTGGVYGSIYVPTSLYASFISATNWATYSARIVSMNF